MINEKYNKTINRFWSYVKIGKVNDCWPWLRAKRDFGHGVFCTDNKLTGAHRFAYEVTYPDFDASLVIRHQCHNPSCCNPRHLLQGTHKDNVHDCMQAGRNAFGTKNGRSKLNDEKVLIIKQLLEINTSKQKIAQLFGVDPKVIRDIAANKKWKHIKMADKIGVEPTRLAA